MESTVKHLHGRLDELGFLYGDVVVLARLFPFVTHELGNRLAHLSVMLANLRAEHARAGVKSAVLSRVEDRMEAMLRDLSAVVEFFTRVIVRREPGVDRGRLSDVVHRVIHAITCLGRTGQQATMLEISKGCEDLIVPADILEWSLGLLLTNALLASFRHHRPRPIESRISVVDGRIVIVVVHDRPDSDGANGNVDTRLLEEGLVLDVIRRVIAQVGGAVSTDASAGRHEYVLTIPEDWQVQDAKNAALG
jgi:hypothetical protein